MSEGYGEHAERLAGYGVGSGELRDYEPFSLEDAETVKANTQKGQTEHDLKWIATVLVNDEESCDQDLQEHFEANDISAEDARFYIAQRNRALRDPLNFKLEPALSQYECVFITNWPFDDKCYQCGKTREEHYKRSPAVNVAPSSAIPEDAEEANQDNL